MHGHTWCGSSSFPFNRSSTRFFTQIVVAIPRHAHRLALMHPGSSNRLNQRHLDRFIGDTLFAKLARTVCRAECLPRKELFETWEVAKRIRRRFRGGPIFDFGAGHGLLAWTLLLLDDSSNIAYCVDPARAPSFDTLSRCLIERWPHLAGRALYLSEDAAEVEIEPGALLVSAHACGTLADVILGRAISGSHRVAVLTCCHDRNRCDTGGLEGWLPIGLAVDATRVARLRGAGFVVHTTTIPQEITPMNRLLLASPRERPPLKPKTS